VKSEHPAEYQVFSRTSPSHSRAWRQERQVDVQKDNADGRGRNAASAAGSSASRRAPWLIQAQRSGFAVLDQGLFAGANFIVNILLARWLEPAEYGAFALAYSVFLLVGAFHGAVLIEPMMVFGSGKYTDTFRAYLGILISSHWRVTGALTLLLIPPPLLLWLFGSHHLPMAMVGMTLASPLILRLWLTRWAFYVHAQPHWAATGGALYVVLMLGGMYILTRQHWLSAASALLTMGLASVIVSAWLTRLLQPQWPAVGSMPTRAMVTTDHWRYGKWATATMALMWLSSDVYYAVLSAWMGLASSGALRTIMNLLMPILHVNGAVANLFVPLFVRELKTAGLMGLHRHTRLALLFFTITSLLYWGVLALFGKNLMHWLYGGRYDGYATVLLVAGLLPIPVGVGSVLACALRALGRPDQIFWGYVVGARCE
jgi:O-antigen/teichoic acid export membrane protein